MMVDYIEKDDPVSADISTLRLQKLDRKRRSRWNRKKIAVGILKFNVPRAYNLLMPSKGPRPGGYIPAGQLTVAVMQIEPNQNDTWTIRGLVIWASELWLYVFEGMRGIEITYQPGSRNGTRESWNVPNFTT